MQYLDSSIFISVDLGWKFVSSLTSFNWLKYNTCENLDEKVIQNIKD